MPRSNWAARKSGGEQAKVRIHVLKWRSLTQLAQDSFSAGVIYGWLNGLPLEETLIMASALGAMATTVNGAGMALPGKRELTTFLKTTAYQKEEWVNRGIKELLAGFKD